MDDFDDNSVLMAITHAYEFQLRKHGNYCGLTTIEDIVNGMTNFELLTMIAEYLDADKEKQNG